MEDHVAVAAEAVQQPGGLAFPGGPALPGAGPLGGPEPQPPAHQGGCGQADQPRPRDTGLGNHGAGDQAGGGHQECPPDQTAGPGGQLGRATAPVLGEGRTARAASDRLGRDRRVGFGARRLSCLSGPGTPGRVYRWVQGGPAAAQPLDGLASVGIEEVLELLGGQGPH
jgi:hypothetical protein